MELFDAILLRVGIVMGGLAIFGIMGLWAYTIWAAT